MVDLTGLGPGLIAIGAGLAMFGGAIGTAWAQTGIGSAAMGTIAERPETGGSLLMWLVIPETIVVLGFVIALLLSGKVV
ncbi:ATP synthase subunit c [Candidatus Burarchaeum australiense]|nr:ATP synthase subunit c [Candidatus Burarchaeum australiense]